MDVSALILLVVFSDLFLVYISGFFRKIEEQIESMFASVKRVTDVAKPMMGTSVTNVNPVPSAVSKNKEALEKARLMASRIHMAKNIGAEAKDITQQAAVSLFRDGFAAPQVSVSLSASPIFNCL
jgi:hypothetical protein